MKAIPIVLMFLLCIGSLQAQGAARFRNEVKSIQQRMDSVWDPAKPSIVFSGSSSVRMWRDVQDRFPEYQILNTGFGGSITAELLLYAEELIIDYQPKKVFIYEGDNDIASKMRRRDILQDMMDLVERIQLKSPNTQIYLISPKPSISRWNLKGKYKRLNKKLAQWADTQEGVQFINVWDVMLNGRKLNETLFIEDGLHMNSTGYDLWEKEIKPYLD